MNNVSTDLPMCYCFNPPTDDGFRTCWVHHRCSDGECTHGDGDFDDGGDSERFDE